MAKFKVTVEVTAPDVMMAGIAQQGIQNVLNELGEHQSFLVELSDPKVAKSYRDKLMTLLNNPMIKKIAGAF
jgi:hypothetical protein